jgi:Adenylate and Guanylate cyclase catalytic domain
MKENILVTRSGECLKANLQHSQGSYGDSRSYQFKVEDLSKGRGSRLIDIVFTREAIVNSGDFTSREDVLCLNAIRDAFDKGKFSFETEPEDPTKYIELTVKGTDIDAPKDQRSDEIIFDFLIAKAYWVGYKYKTYQNPAPTFVNLESEEDLDYLGVALNDLRRVVQRMKQKGLLQSSGFPAIALANPTEKLLELFEAEQNGAPLTKQDHSESPIVEYAHVLFTDIVSYSTEPIDMQLRMVGTLKKAVSETPSFRKAYESGELISLPTGDGIALVFLRDAQGPAMCAIELNTSLKNADIRLRMGINSGPVLRSADINSNKNLVGEGINIAQRVMDLGDAGHILLSSGAAEILLHMSRWPTLLHDIGEAKVKHGARIRVFNLYSTEIGNPNSPTKMAKPRSSAHDGAAEERVKTTTRGSKQPEQPAKHASSGEGRIESNLTLQKRLAAGEALWSVVLDLRETLSAAVNFYAILQPQEYDSVFEETDKTQYLVSSITDQAIVDAMRRTSRVENDRPYLSDVLWSLFFIYRAFLGRLAALIEMGKRKRHIEDWRMDRGVRQILGNVFQEQELKHLLGSDRDPNAIYRIVDRLQCLILEQVRLVASGG